MLAGSPELGLARHVVDLLAHLAEGAVDALALGLDVLGDGVLDDDARLVEHRLPLAIPATSFRPESRSGPALRSRPRRAPSTSRAPAIISDSTIATVCSASISTSS